MEKVIFSCLSVLTPCRAIRLDNHTADNCYITGGYLATVFAKNGLKLSLSDLRMIVENYSAPREVLDRDPTLIEVARPSPGYSDFFRD